MRNSNSKNNAAKGNRKESAYPKGNRERHEENESRALRPAHKGTKKDNKWWGKPKEGDTAKANDYNTMRLNKFIANAGVCNRRDADKLITDGEITVNGELVTELGVKVSRKDNVCYNGKRIFSEQKVYLLLNKPKGFVTNVENKREDRSVLQLVANACQERLHPVGNLGKDTTGLLLFTNDADLASRLSQTSYKKKKIYHVFLANDFPEENMEAIKKGIELEDGFVKGDVVSYVDPADKTQIGIEIQSGKNRIVRRIFDHFGFPVQKLDRVFYAGLTKKNLPRGRYRFLTPKEVSFLKMS